MAGPPPGAGLAADDDQPPAHSRDAGRPSSRERLDDHLRTLERLDPAGEHDDRVPPVDPRSCLARSWSPGVKTSVSTPGGTTSIRVGSAPYRSISSAASVGGVGDQPVRLGDDLLLADQPAARFRFVVVGHRGVLDLGQGVRGMHQRHPPAVLGQVPDLAGQPVVRVHDVVVARVRCGPRPASPRPRTSTAGRAVPACPAPRTGRPRCAGPARPASARRPGADRTTWPW